MRIVNKEGSGTIWLKKASQDNGIKTDFVVVVVVIVLRILKIC